MEEGKMADAKEMQIGGSEKENNDQISYQETEKKVTKRIPVPRDKNVRKVVKIRKEEELPLPDGVYLYYPEQERYIALSEKVSAYGDKEYAFLGNLTMGEIKIIKVENGVRYILPLKGDWNYGYTLEGDAKALFHVTDALLDYNAKEARSFAYITATSKLYFSGVEGRYFLTLRLFGEEGKEGKRWVVLYLSRRR